MAVDLSDSVVVSVRVQDDGDVRAGGASVQQRERRVDGAGHLQQLQQLQTRQRRAPDAAHQVTLSLATRV